MASQLSFPETESDHRSSDSDNQTRARRSNMKDMDGRRDNDHQKAEQERQIAPYLEHLTQLSATAVNTRDFDPTSPAWKFVDSHCFESIGSALHAKPGQKFGHHEVLEMLREATTANPEMEITLTDMITEINATLDRAVVHYNVETRGAPPGIVRQGICRAEYRWREEDGWMRVRHRGMSLLSEFAFSRTLHKDLVGSEDS